MLCLENHTWTSNLKQSNIHEKSICKSVQLCASKIRSLDDGSFEIAIRLLQWLNPRNFSLQSWLIPSRRIQISDPLRSNACKDERLGIFLFRNRFTPMEKGSNAWGDDRLANLDVTLLRRISLTTKTFRY